MDLSISSPTQSRIISPESRTISSDRDRKTSKSLQDVRNPDALINHLRRSTSEGGVVGCKKHEEGNKKINDFNVTELGCKSKPSVTTQNSQVHSEQNPCQLSNPSVDKSDSENCPVKNEQSQPVLNEIQDCVIDVFDDSNENTPLLKDECDVSKDTMLLDEDKKTGSEISSGENKQDACSTSDTSVLEVKGQKKTTQLPGRRFILNKVKEQDLQDLPGASNVVASSVRSKENDSVSLKSDHSLQASSPSDMPTLYREIYLFLNDVVNELVQEYSINSGVERGQKSNPVENYKRGRLYWLLSEAFSLYDASVSPVQLLKNKFAGKLNELISKLDGVDSKSKEKISVALKSLENTDDYEKLNASTFKKLGLSGEKEDSLCIKNNFYYIFHTATDSIIKSSLNDSDIDSAGDNTVYELKNLIMFYFLSVCLIDIPQKSFEQYNVPASISLQDRAKKAKDPRAQIALNLLTSCFKSSTVFTMFFVSMIATFIHSMDVGYFSSNFPGSDFFGLFMGVYACLVIMMAAFGNSVAIVKTEQLNSNENKTITKLSSGTCALKEGESAAGFFLSTFKLGQWMPITQSVFAMLIPERVALANKIILDKLKPRDWFLTALPTAVSMVPLALPYMFPDGYKNIAYNNDSPRFGEHFFRSVFNGLFCAQENNTAEALRWIVLLSCGVGASSHVYLAKVWDDLSKKVPDAKSFKNALHGRSMGTALTMLLSVMTPFTAPVRKAVDLICSTLYGNNNASHVFANINGTDTFPTYMVPVAAENATVYECMPNVPNFDDNTRGELIYFGFFFIALLDFTKSALWESIAKKLNKVLIKEPIKKIRLKQLNKDFVEAHEKNINKINGDITYFNYLNAMFEALKKVDAINILSELLRMPDNEQEGLLTVMTLNEQKTFDFEDSKKLQQEVVKSNNKNKGYDIVSVYLEDPKSLFFEKSKNDSITQEGLVDAVDIVKQNGGDEKLNILEGSQQFSVFQSRNHQSGDDSNSPKSVPAERKSFGFTEFDEARITVLS